MNTRRIGKHSVHVRFVQLLGVEFLCLIGAAWLAQRLASPELTWMAMLPVWLGRSVLFALAVIACLYAFGLYHTHRPGQAPFVALRVIAGVVSAGFLLIAASYLLPALWMPPQALFYALCVSVAALFAVQLTFYYRCNQHSASWRVLIYGAGSNAAELLAQMRRRSDHSLFHLVGCLPVPGETTHVAAEQVCASPNSLVALAREQWVDEIVVAMDDRRGSLPTSDLLDCRVAGINVIDALTFYERQARKIKFELLEPGWLIFNHGFDCHPIQDGFKRTLDAIASALLLMLTLPVLLTVATAILIADGFASPIFFAQLRVGRDGREFVVHKFRTMHASPAAAEGPQWASENDPRVTWIGGFLRQYRLDELPQLFDVLRGDMSLVGPRPEQPGFVDDLKASLPFYGIRERVRPGITGWAQLKYPYGASETDTKHKLELDLYYVKNRSLLLDLMILLRTVEVVFFRIGSR